MGFMGLDHWSESDNAADFHARLRLKIREEFRTQVKEKANRYNTPGWLNALLIIKEYPDLVEFLDSGTLKAIKRGIDNDTGYLKVSGGDILAHMFESQNCLKDWWEGK